MLHKLDLRPRSDLTTGRFKILPLSDGFDERVVQFVSFHGLTPDRARALAEPIFENWQGLPVPDSDLIVLDNTPKIDQALIAPATGYPPQAFSLNPFATALNTANIAASPDATLSTYTVDLDWIAPGAMFRTSD